MLWLNFVYFILVQRTRIYFNRNGYETMGDKDSRRQHLHYIGHNHSRDSAIDADLQDLGTETVEIPIELVIIILNHFYIAI